VSDPVLTFPSLAASSNSDAATAEPQAAVVGLPPRRNGLTEGDIAALEAFIAKAKHLGAMTCEVETDADGNRWVAFVPHHEGHGEELAAFSVVRRDGCFNLFDATGMVFVCSGDIEILIETLVASPVGGQPRYRAVRSRDR
jgi:hypothetical protein